MSHMLRIVCLFILLLSDSLISQTAELPSVEAVTELYEKYSVPFNAAQEGRPALLILSSGCAQCVELATVYADELNILATERGFKTRFIEMPGAVAIPDIDLGEETRDPDALLQQARIVANSASMILSCHASQSGENALSMIADIGRAARLLAGTAPNPQRLLTSDWANWVYLSDFDDSGQLQSTAAAVLQMVVGARNIDLSTCDQDSVWAQLGERHAAILASGINYVPGLYLLPDETFPRFMVWDYAELLEVLQN